MRNLTDLGVEFSAPPGAAGILLAPRFFSINRDEGEGLNFLKGMEGMEGMGVWSRAGSEIDDQCQSLSESEHR